MLSVRRSHWTIGRTIMSPTIKLRTARAADAEALLDIYRPYVESTSTSFELSVPSVQQFRERIEKALDHSTWIVAEIEGNVVGYAYGSAHRAREAYAYSVETSAYVHEEFHRQGIARALYTALLDKLKALGYESAFAGVTLPNDASIAFHKSLGFKSIGVFPRIGYKFGKWHDVAWLYRPIAGKSD